MPSPPPARHPMATKRLRHIVDGAEAVAVETDVALSDGRSVVDVYRPPDPHREPRGWVLFVNGLSDDGARRVLGCAIKDMASYESWGRAVAARGLVGITHATHADAAADARHVWTALHADGQALGLAPGRGAVWACSAHVPNALGLLCDARPTPAAAALCYGYMLDRVGDDAVARAQQTWRFVTPAAGRTVADLARAPLLVVRAGADQTPGVNASIDAFAQEAMAANANITVTNYAGAGHAFDLDDAGRASRDVVEEVLDFLARHTAP